MLAAALVACGTPRSEADAGSAPVDAGARDGGPLTVDVGPPDAGSTDAGADAGADAGPMDTGVPDAGRGDAGGECRDRHQCGSSASADFCMNCYVTAQGEVLPGEAGCWCEPRAIYATRGSASARRAPRLRLTRFLVGSRAMTEPKQDDDRREAPRETAYVGAEILTGEGAPHLAVVQNASAKGIALLTRYPAEAGEAIEVGVQVDSELRIHVTGSVVRRTDHDGDGPWRWRVAIELEPPSDELAEHAGRINRRQSSPPPAK